MHAHLGIPKRRAQPKNIFVSDQLFGEPIEAKGAATEVEHIIVGRHLRFEVSDDGVETLRAVFFQFEEAGFAQDAEMFGDVILRNVEAFRDFIDAERFLEEQAKDSESRFLSERFESRDTI